MEFSFFVVVRYILRLSLHSLENHSSARTRRAFTQDEILDDNDDVNDDSVECDMCITDSRNKTHIPV